MGGAFCVMMMSLHSEGPGFSNHNMLCHTITIDFWGKYLKTFFGPGMGWFFPKKLNYRATIWLNQRYHKNIIDWGLYNNEDVLTRSCLTHWVTLTAGLVFLQTCAVLCRNTQDIFYSESFSVWPTFNAASGEFAQISTGLMLLQSLGVHL